MKHHYLFSGHLCDSEQLTVENHAQHKIRQPRGRFVYHSLLYLPCDQAAQQRSVNNPLLGSGSVWRTGFDT